MRVLLCLLCMVWGLAVSERAACWPLHAWALLHRESGGRGPGAMPALQAIVVAATTMAAATSAPAGHACQPGHNSSALPFCNASLPITERVRDLVGRLSVDEKAHLIAIRGDSPDAGVARLGIPPYNWGVEILHGAGISCIGPHCPTILPVLACAASTFNRSAWTAMGAVISTEMRAAHNNNGTTRPGSTDPVGLNGWGPNINLARDVCTFPPVQTSSIDLVSAEIKCTL
jgi:hypothetical protein